ncbi:MAG: glycosyltransferase family 39 protein, partial [Candidatus Daviesbacteria bacterium]|nr:glycosyltransferase family 39 protein [Candidatus Daviesbacteria bacterium]
MVKTSLERVLMSNIFKKIQNNRLELLILLIILTIAIFLRFFRLSEYMTFLGDEGRDALIVKRILTQGDIPFIGPPSSVGNLYLGPFYYYLMALSMSIFWLNPVASAGMVALIGSLTVFLIYYFGRLLFNNWTGLVAALLYAISPITINYSRSSWNPNPAPFFAILTFISLYKAHLSGSRVWLFWCGVFLSGAVQMHYLTLPLLPAVLVFWIIKCHFQKLSKSFFTTSILALILGFNLTLLPWWLFELKHNFVNLRGIKEIFFGTQSSVGFNLFIYLEKTFNTTLYVLIGDYLAGNNFLISLSVL